jgi:ABC-2 type transport system ATP-binding protein
VVFLDEPMSGLDPIGRHDVRDIILRLRDRGTTVFFSSHILGDAETLCSRVAIVAQGKLVAAGSLAEMVPFRVRGWDLIVTGLNAAAVAVFTGTGATAREIADGRHHLILPEDTSVDDAMARLSAVGGQLVSMQPVRDTLEDLFVRQVSAASGRGARS